MRICPCLSHVETSEAAFEGSMVDRRLLLALNLVAVEELKLSYSTRYI